MKTDAERQTLSGAWVNSVEEEEERLKEQEKLRTTKEKLQNQLTLGPQKLTETELANQSACMGRT